MGTAGPVGPLPEVWTAPPRQFAGSKAERMYGNRAGKLAGP